MNFLPDVIPSLNSALGAPSGTGHRTPYSPIVFTSQLRLKSSLAGASSTFYDGVIQLEPYVKMGINPNSIGWDQPKRYSKQDTQEGSVFFHFTNSQGQNNDILTLSFKGNTGSIDQELLDDLEAGGAQARGLPPIRDSEHAAAVANALAWHNLYLLTREPNVLSDGTENVWIITYMSKLFPQSIDFYGFFNSVLKFSEEAEDPNSRDYAFDFTVTSTEPPLDRYINEVNAYFQQANTLPSSNSAIAGSNVDPFTA